MELKDLFEIKCKLEPFIDEFVSELTKKAFDEVLDSTYSRDELIAYSEMIRGAVSSKVGYELLLQAFWKSDEIK